MGIHDVNFRTTQPVTAGPTSTLGENVEAEFDRILVTNSSLSLQFEVHEAWEKTLKAYKERTGIDPTNAPRPSDSLFNLRRQAPNEIDSGDIPALTAALNTMIDPNNQSISASVFASGVSAEQVQAILDLNEKIKALGDPNIQDLETILAQTIAHQKAVEEQTSEIQSRAGFSGKLGAFVGGVAGSMSIRNPALLATLPIGGVGKSIATKIATEMAVGGVVQGATQHFDINPTRRASGLPEVSPLEAGIYGAVGAGVLRGGFEGLGVLARRFAGDAPESARLDDIEVQLKQTFEQAPESPRARAGLSLLEDKQVFDAHNPYPKTEAGSQAFAKDIYDVALVLDGQAETAVRQILPETHYDFTGITYDKLLAKEKSPEIFAVAEATEARLGELDNKIAEAERRIEGITLSDAVGAVDEKSGVVVRNLEETLKAAPLTALGRQEIIQKVANVVKSLGEDNVSAATKALQKGSRGELRALRKERKTALTDNEKAQKDLSKVMAGVKKTPPQIAERPAFPTAKGKKTGVFTYGPAHLQNEVVDDMARAVDETTEIVPDRMEEIVATPPSEDGKLDLGNGTMVDPEFKIALSDGSEISAKDIFEDLKNDSAMLEAMRTCSI